MRHLFYFSNNRHWYSMAEQALLRGIMLGAGVILIFLGIGMGFTMVMLPIGAFFALIGLALIARAVSNTVAPS